MNNPFIGAALVGTTRQEPVDEKTGTPLDSLLTTLPQNETERKLLLSAGAWAVYQQAGLRPRRCETFPEPAGPEQLPACSPQAALLLSQLFQNDERELLSEALDRLRLRGLRLPYYLLPQALDLGAQNKGLRAILYPVLGERGRWLSRFQLAWQWARDYLSIDEVGLPSDAETIWLEGTPGQRVEILRHLRAIDPARARTWLEEVWKQEKAEVRRELLKCLEIGLENADEPFLEKALDDRGSEVRALAVSLLSRLPETAFSRRMRERGRRILNKSADKLLVTLPAALFETSWRRDGIGGKPPTPGLGERAWWFTQILALTPPAFWEKHLEAEPADLVERATGHEWESSLIAGWSQAAVNYAATDWLVPLWRWWIAYYRRHGKRRPSMHNESLPEQLLRKMPAPLAEQAMLDLLRQEDLPDNWWNWLLAVPRPWSAEFARAYLRLWRERFPLEVLAAPGFRPYMHAWFRELRGVAFALPPASFPTALLPWDLPTSAEGSSTAEQYVTAPQSYVEHQLQEFADIIHTRQKINEEII